MKAFSTVTMRTVAKRQISRAISLAMHERDFISALTLAGAAEEILGKIGHQRRGSTAVDESVVWFGQMAGMLGAAAPEKKKVISAINRARNQAKHNDGGRDRRLRKNWEFEALDMIDRALRNYELAFGKIPSDPIFEVYVEEFWT